MAKKSIIYFLVLMGLGSCTATLAQPVCHDLPKTLADKALTLIELTDIALSCHPATRLAWANTKTSIADLGLAYSTFWPQLNGTVDLNYAFNTIGKAGSASTRSNNKQQLTYGPGISVSYLLWDFGVRFQQLKAADFQLQAARFSENTTFQQIILQVEQNYYQLIGQQATVKSNKDNLKENKANLEVADALHKQGMATVLDVYQAKSALSQSQLNLEQSEGTLRAMEGQLAASVGLSIHTTLKLAPLSDKVVTHPVLESMSELMKIAKHHRPDLLAAEAQTKAADASLLAIKRKNWPSISLNSNNQKLFGGNALTTGRSSTVILSLNIPIFLGFSDKYTIMQAEAKKEQALAIQDTLSQQVDLQVWQAYYALETAAKAIQSSSQFLESSLQANKQAYGQYQAGVGNIITVLTAQAALSNARSQSIQARVNWYIALAELAVALGRANV